MDEEAALERLSRDDVDASPAGLPSARTVDDLIAAFLHGTVETHEDHEPCRDDR